MFLKRTKSKSYEYTQVTESYRDKDGKTRHKVIANLGRIDQLRENGFHKIIAELAKLIDLKIESSNKDGIPEMFEKERSSYGVYFAQSIPCISVKGYHYFPTILSLQN